jgi:hypothetical protein
VIDNRQVISLVYDYETNACSVDIGELDPWIATRIMHEAADQLEDLAPEPTFTFTIAGIQYHCVIEQDED